MLTDVMAMETPSEWSAACEVQQRFMRTLIPAPGMVDYSAQCRQLEELGGDFYHFTPLPENGFTIAIGDASGKGLAAALMISNVQSSLRTAAFFTGDNVAALLEAVNHQVYESSLEHRYATLFYGVFDHATRTLRYVNAGHHSPMVIRRDGSIDWLETGGAPVGMFPDWSYEEGVVRLNPGDLLLAYTDGVTEAVNPFGEQWGIDGLRRAASGAGAQSAAAVVDAIFAALDEFSDGCRADDATLVALRVH